MSRGVPKPDRATVGFPVRLDPVTHALVALKAARRGVSIRTHLHQLIEEQHNMSTPNTDCGPTSGAAQRDAEARANAAGDALARLGAGLPLQRPSTTASKPTLLRDGEEGHLAYEAHIKANRT